MVVRFGDLYGPERPFLLDGVLAGRPLAPADLQRFANPIHQADAAGLLAHVMMRKRPRPTYLAVDREPAAVPDVTAWLAGQLDGPAPVVDGSAPAADPEAPNVRGMSERLVDDGYRFVHASFREGYAATLARLRR